MKVFFGHKYPVPTQFTVHQTLFFTLLSSLFYLFYCFYYSIQIFFLMHIYSISVCMHVHKVSVVSMQTHQYRKKGCHLPSDSFQISDCNSSSLKQPFIGVPWDTEFIFRVSHYWSLQNAQNKKFVILLYYCLLHCNATLLKSLISGVKSLR